MPPTTWATDSIRPTSSSTPDSEGNYVGNPAFVFPVDPRPGSDGPADLFVDGDFQLTAQSAAIDNAWEATAIPTDLLGNSQVKIDDDGYGLPGFGPRDVGALEFDGTGGTPVGGSFRVVTTSLVPIGGAEYADGSTLVTSTAPTAITLTFSGNVNQNSINATDLVLSGTAVNSLGARPCHESHLDRRRHGAVQSVRPAQSAGHAQRGRPARFDRQRERSGQPGLLGQGRDSDRHASGAREPDADADADLDADFADLATPTSPTATTVADADAPAPAPSPVSVYEEEASAARQEGRASEAGQASTCTPSRSSTSCTPSRSSTSCTPSRSITRSSRPSSITAEVKVVKVATPHHQETKPRGSGPQAQEAEA